MSVGANWGRIKRNSNLRREANFPGVGLKNRPQGDTFGRTGRPDNLPPPPDNFPGEIRRTTVSEGRLGEVHEDDDDEGLPRAVLVEGERLLPLLGPFLAVPVVPPHHPLGAG